MTEQSEATATTIEAHPAGVGDNNLTVAKAERKTAGGGRKEKQPKVDRTGWKKPSWRWEEAMEGLRTGQPSADPLILNAQKFIRDLLDSNVEARLVFRRHRIMASAWTFYYCRTGPAQMRWIVEAGIICRLSSLQISELLLRCTIPAVIQTYEDFFFDVRNRLTDWAYLCEMAKPNGKDWDPCGRDYEHFLREYRMPNMHTPESAFEGLQSYSYPEALRLRTSGLRKLFEQQRDRDVAFKLHVPQSGLPSIANCTTARL
jgi:hypothetical protein